MSAYMVDRDHIEYLLDAAMSRGITDGSLRWRWKDGDVWRSGRLDAGDYDHAAKCGQMLWDANRKSIETRYPDTLENFCERAPGPVDETFVYHLHLGRYYKMDAVQVIKACHCFEYQSCEFEAWEDSEACAFTTALIKHAVSRLPGYGDAEWGAPALPEGVVLL